jgi:hypothetical protein
MNKKLIAISITLGFLMSVMPAYGFLIVPPPENQNFSHSGMTYAVPYACTGIPGDSTEIFVHNDQKFDQFVYVKILDLYNPSMWAVSGSEPTTYRFTIPADGLLWIDCTEIWAQLAISAGTQSKGLAVISQPGGTSTTALDVVASYKLIVSNSGGTDYVGGSSSVVYVPGTKVSSVPTPCVIVKPSTKCQALPL